MHQTVAVREGQRGSNVGSHLGGPIGRQGPVGAEDLRQAPPVHVLHDDEVGALLFAPVEDAHHVGMVQVGRCLSLPTKPLHEVGISGKFVEQDLDRHWSVQEEITRQVDVGHASPGNLPVEFVPPIEDGGALC